MKSPEPRQMNPKEFLDTIQQFEAVAAIGTSAVRGQPEGTVKNCREFLGKINLSQTPYQSQDAFNNWLNRQTFCLQEILPNKDKPWGIARKALNLFLRSCLYNRFLYKEYSFSRVEKWLEIPIDGIVAKALKKYAGGKIVPRWQGIKRLQPHESEVFQAVAEQYSCQMNLPARVYLDNYLWLKGR